jgi:hypothetical protein
MRDSAPLSVAGSDCAPEKEERTVLAELRVTPIGSRTSFARLIADLVPVLAESRLQHVRDLRVEAPLERLVHPQSR